MKLIQKVISLITLVIVILPLYILLIGSFMGSEEIKLSLGTIFGDGIRPVSFPVLPRYPTAGAYTMLFIDTPEFFVMFWNSCQHVFFVLAGQFFISVPAAWAFAKGNFRGKNILFILYIILMVMPFQVLMVPNYLVLNKLNLLNTPLSIILPGIFSTFPVFIITRFFSSISNSLLEAARIDGASEFIIFVKIGVPLGSSGILSAMILSFLEYWNLIEAPLTYLTDKSLWPLSLYLPNISLDKAALSLAASVIMIIPAVLIFLSGQDYLEAGIAQYGLKE